MKILCLADLHISSRKDYRQKKHWIRGLITEYNPDVIVVAGDIFETGFYLRYNPYEKLSQISNIPFICVLGNHEFVDLSIQNTLDEYREKYDPQQYNVHYLDIIGHYDIKNVRFSGNVLWYDSKMRHYKDQSVYDWGGNPGLGNGYWLDRKIIDFDYKLENDKCVKQIKENIDPTKTNVLVTHCVPKETINGHIPNELNIFSGMKNLLKDIDVQYSISGHTHKRIIGLDEHNTYCINVGNDYYLPYHHYVLEI
jgi:predicted MPP superfamily phosphohydrolase